jgi:hypothetical protein
MTRFSLLFASLLCLPLTLACDDGDDGSDEAADTNDNAEADTTDEGPSDDVTCEVYCEAFITQCLQTGESMEFETNDACLAACGAWDQAGINCRNQQIGAGMCDQAGDMGSSC